MTYDDIRKDLAIYTGFLQGLKKDISSGQTRNYPNVLNALIRLDKTMRSLRKILNEEDNKAIRGSYDDIKNSIKEIRAIVSDSIDKPASWIKVTGCLESFIADLNDLSELLAETSLRQPRSEEKDAQVLTDLERQWSKPMTKAAIMKALGLDSYKTLKTFNKTHPIRNAGSKKLWQIQLDGLNRKQIEKLTKA